MKLNQLFKLLTLACVTASCTAHTSFSKRLNNMKELQQLAEDFAECKTENKPPLSYLKQLESSLRIETKTHLLPAGEVAVKCADKEDKKPEPSDVAPPRKRQQRQ